MAVSRVSQENQVDATFYDLVSAGNVNCIIGNQIQRNKHNSYHPLSQAPPTTPPQAPEEEYQCHIVRWVCGMGDLLVIFLEKDSQYLEKC